MNVKVGAKRREVEMLAENQNVLDGFLSSWKQREKGQSRGALSTSPPEKLQGGRSLLSMNMVSPPPQIEISLTVNALPFKKCM